MKMNIKQAFTFNTVSAKKPNGDDGEDSFLQSSISSVDKPALKQANLMHQIDLSSLSNAGRQ